MVASILSNFLEVININNRLPVRRKTNSANKPDFTRIESKLVFIAESIYLKGGIFFCLSKH